MKRLKRTIASILTLSIMMSWENLQATAKETDVVNYQEAAYNAYLNMSENLDIRMDMISEDYPDTFGGCYLDGDKLIVLVTNLESETKQYYLNACEDEENVIFQQVSYTYEYLLDLEKETVTEMNGVTEVHEHYVDVIDNTVNIGIASSYDKGVEFFRAVNDSPIVIYEMESLPQATAMRGGEQLNNDSPYPFSICFFGTYNSKASLVTCGHTNPVGTNIYYGGTKVGTVTKQNLKTYIDTDAVPASYGDFSIVDISSSTVAGSSSVKAVSGSINATGTANLVVGLTVKMYGNVTTYISGTVQNTSVSANFDDPITLERYRVKGLVTISSTTQVQQGDSGGCAIYTTSAGINRVAGCITGVKEGVYSYITPSSYIEASGFSFN